MARPSSSVDEALLRAGKVLAAHDYLAEVARTRALILTPLFLVGSLLVALLFSIDGSCLFVCLSVALALSSTVLVGWVLVAVARREIEATEVWRDRVHVSVTRHLAFLVGSGVDLNQAEVSILHQLTDSTWERNAVARHNRALALALGVSREAKKGSK
jgi:hypothetical protein